MPRPAHCPTSQRGSCRSPRPLCPPPHTPHAPRRHRENSLPQRTILPAIITPPASQERRAGGAAAAFLRAGGRGESAAQTALQGARRGCSAARPQRAVLRPILRRRSGGVGVIGGRVHGLVRSGRRFGRTCRVVGGFGSSRTYRGVAMGTCDRNSPGQSSLIDGGLSVVVRYIYTLRLYIRCDVAVKKLYVVRVAGVLANVRGSSLPLPYLYVYFFLSLSRN